MRSFTVNKALNLTLGFVGPLNHFPHSLPTSAKWQQSYCPFHKITKKHKWGKSDKSTVNSSVTSKEKELEACTTQNSSYVKRAVAKGWNLAMSTPAHSAAGTEDLQHTASVHEQMKTMMADVSLPIPQLGAWAGRFAVLRPWGYLPMELQPPLVLQANFWFSAARVCWAPGMGSATPPGLTIPHHLRTQVWVLASFPSFWPIHLYFWG